MVSFESVNEAISRIDQHLKKRYWHFVRRVAYTAPPIGPGEEKLFVASLLMIVVESPYFTDPMRRGDVMRFTKHAEAWIAPGNAFHEGCWLETASANALIADIMEIIEELNS